MNKLLETCNKEDLQSDQKESPVSLEIAFQ